MFSKRLSAHHFNHSKFPVNKLSPVFTLRQGQKISPVALRDTSFPNLGGLFSFDSYARPQRLYDVKAPNCSYVLVDVRPTFSHLPRLGTGS